MDDVVRFCVFNLRTLPVGSERIPDTLSHRQTDYFQIPHCCVLPEGVAPCDGMHGGSTVGPRGVTELHKNSVRGILLVGNSRDWARIRDLLRRYKASEQK